MHDYVGKILGNAAKDTRHERSFIKDEMFNTDGKVKQRAIPLRNYLTNEVFYDTLYTEADRVIIQILPMSLEIIRMIRITYRKTIILCK